MADGNQLQKHIVPLVGGLDLVSPRFFVTPGTLADCLNYETYSVAGYSVVDGIQRYDGTYPCFNRDWVVATRSSGSGNFNIGEYLKVGTVYFGQCIYWDSTNGILHYLILNQAATPTVGQTITGTAGSTLTTGVGGIKRASRYYSDMASFLEQQRVIYEAARTRKSPPWSYISYAKNVIPHGLHFYKSHLYAIVDNFQITFTTGTAQVFPGDQIVMSSVPGAVVLSTNVTSGAWSSGNAAGTMVIRFFTGFTPALLSLGSTSIVRPNGATATTTISNAFSITDIQTPNSPTAGMVFAPYDDDFQSAQQIADTANNLINFGETWVPVDMGWEIQFTTDSDTTGDAPLTVFRGNFAQDALSSTTSVSGVASAETLDSTATVTHPLAGVSATQPASTALHTVLGDASTSTYVTPGTVSGPSDITTAYATVTGFSNLASIPDGSIITGIEITGAFQTGGNTTAEYNFLLSGSQLAGQTTTTKTATLSAAFGSTITLGGDGDLWGLTLSAPNLLSAIRDDATFGLRFNAHQHVATATENSRLSDLSLKIYYKIPITAYYAHDPVSGMDLQVGIPYYHLNKGQFNPGVDQTLWATGSMSLYNITPLNSTGGGGSVATTSWTIQSGWQLRTARDGGGALIAKFAAQMEAATLPARATLDAANTRFEMITANYYANADWAAIYGVDGVGPAWQYDGYYFYNTYTALNKTEDTPTHIVYHRNYAILGYANGQIVVSVPGSPTDFIPEDGSTLYPFGQRITGLLSLNGTALGVFCQSSIYALTGDVLIASDDNNAVSQVIAPYSGAIEYAILDCGIPLFADFRGISTIDATNKYGDFENGRISYQITPLLVNRVNDRFAYQATAQDIFAAYACRSKNQARFLCKDGTTITLCLPVGDRGYEFTLQRYVDNANLDTMVPVAIAVGTSKSGRDLLFGTFRLVPYEDTNISTPNAPEREVYVYSLDKGTRFDLAPIQHFARLNFMTVDDPNAFSTVRKLRLEMLAQHYFNEYVQLQADYEPTNHVKLPITISPVDQPVRIDRDSEYVVKEVEGIGTTISIEIGGEHIYPGHVLQAMLLYSLPAREQLGNGPTQTL